MNHGLHYHSARTPRTLGSEPSPPRPQPPSPRNLRDPKPPARLGAACVERASAIGTRAAQRCNGSLRTSCAHQLSVCFTSALSFPRSMLVRRRAYPARARLAS
eukprot:6188809-Pleurochrysis_carterae.AAC.3